MGLLDVLRGFAVLGILSVNLPLFFAPIYLEVTDVEWWTGSLDRAVETAIAFLAQGKFYTLFSLLFGVGLALQADRTAGRGQPVPRFLARRLIGLLLLGLLHATLIWFGDILAVYAVTGLLALVFLHRRCTPWTLLLCSLILMLIPLLIIGGLTGLFALSGLDPELAADLETYLAESAAQNTEKLEEARRVYSTGTWREILRVNAGQLGTVYGMIPLYLPQILALFLLGLAASRQGWFQDPERLAGLASRWIGPLFAVGLPANAVMAWAASRVNPAQPSPLGFVQQVAFTVGTPTLCLGYVAVVVLLYRRPIWRRGLDRLAPVGRMALTNYLLHSLLFTSVANPYGLGLYGQVSPALGLSLTCLTFAAQIPLSHWWLRHFRFGPVEWLWRSWTYGRVQPLRLVQ